MPSPSTLMTHGSASLSLVLDVALDAFLAAFLATAAEAATAVAVVAVDVVDDAADDAVAVVVVAAVAAAVAGRVTACACEMVFSNSASRRSVALSMVVASRTSSVTALAPAASSTHPASSRLSSS